MKYIKVPYSRLRGKKYINPELSASEASIIENYLISLVAQEASSLYDTTFQELYKEYANGEDPALGTHTGVIFSVVSGTDALRIHRAIQSIADKFGYEAPSIEGLNFFPPEVYERIAVPNSYFALEGRKYSMNYLIETDKDLNMTVVELPSDSQSEKYFVTVDESGNVLIPQEAYDRNIDVL